MKRAYKPLLFAFAIAIGLYILSINSPNEPFQGSGILSEEERERKKDKEGPGRRAQMYMKEKEEREKKQVEAAKKGWIIFFSVIGGILGLLLLLGIIGAAMKR